VLWVRVCALVVLVAHNFDSLLKSILHFWLDCIDELMQYRFTLHSAHAILTPTTVDPLI